MDDKFQQLRELNSMFEVTIQLHSVHKMLQSLRGTSGEMKLIFGAKSAGSQDPEQVKAENILRVQTMAFVNYLLTSKHFVGQVRTIYFVIVPLK